MESNPCTSIRLPTAEELPPLVLTIQETRTALIYAWRHGFYGQLMLAINAGFRMSEIRHLEWRDVEFDQRQVTVRRAKGNKFRTIR